MYLRVRDLLKQLYASSYVPREIWDLVKTGACLSDVVLYTETWLLPSAHEKDHCSPTKPNKAPEILGLQTDRFSRRNVAAASLNQENKH